MEHIPIVVFKNGEVLGTYPNLQKLHRYMKTEFPTYTDNRIYDIINHGIDDLNRVNLNGDIYEFRTKEVIRLKRAERKTRSHKTDLSGQYRNIKRIEASIGGYFGTSYKFEVDLVSGEFFWSTEGDDFEPGIASKMDSEGLEIFIEALSKCRVLSWKNEYMDRDVLDGTQWSLDIQLDDLCIEKSGSNAYPKEWKRFCKVIQNMTGKPFH
jgi:hypothetical protein